MPQGNQRTNRDDNDDDDDDDDDDDETIKMIEGEYYISKLYIP